MSDKFEPTAEEKMADAPPANAKYVAAHQNSRTGNPRRAVPPTTQGHPYRCATAPNISAIADDGGWVSGVHECAALPANRARACGV
jgi:hypothetical protein